MAEPLVFVTTLAIHEGKVGQFREAARKAVEFAEAKGPQLFMGVYIDEENSVANGIQVHRDSDSILSQPDLLERVRREAARAGIPYQTFIKSMLEAGVSRLERRRPSTARGRKSGGSRRQKAGTLRRA